MKFKHILSLTIDNVMLISFSQQFKNICIANFTYLDKINAESAIPQI